jgi:hypothetical protein
MLITRTSWMEQDEMSLGCDVHGDSLPSLLDPLQVPVPGGADRIMSAEKYLAEAKGRHLQVPVVVPRHGGLRTQMSGGGAMPIVAMSWHRGDAISRSTDVHMLRGSSSPSLIEVLQVTELFAKPVSAADYVKKGPNDVTFEFRPLFGVK